MRKSEKNKNPFADIIAVTNRSLCERRFLEQIERVCRVKPRAVLLREKDLSAEEYQKLAQEILQLCAAYDVPCILHFYPKAAEALRCRMLHLPLPALRESRGMVRAEVLGCSVHSVEEAMEAQRLGATYLTAGHIYETDCKKGVPPRGLFFLRDVCEAVQIPVYAIGGMKMEGTGFPKERDCDRIDLMPASGQMEEIFACGAAGACIMSGMMRL